MENHKESENTTFGIRAVGPRTVIGGDGPILKRDGAINMVATFDLLLNIVADIKLDITRMQKRVATPLTVVDAKIVDRQEEATKQEVQELFDKIPDSDVEEVHELFDKMSDSDVEISAAIESVGAVKNSDDVDESVLDAQFHLLTVDWVENDYKLEEFEPPICLARIDWKKHKQKETFPCTLSNNPTFASDALDKIYFTNSINKKSHEIRGGSASLFQGTVPNPVKLVNVLPQRDLAMSWNVNRNKSENVDLELSAYGVQVGEICLKEEYFHKLLYASSDRVFRWLFGAVRRAEVTASESYRNFNSYICTSRNRAVLVWHGNLLMNYKKKSHLKSGGFAKTHFVSQCEDVIHILEHSIEYAFDRMATINHKQIEKAIPTTSKVTISTLDKTRRGAPASISPHLFFKRLTRQLLHQTEAWDLKLVNRSFVADDHLVNDIILFPGEVLTRVSRRKSADVLISEIILKILRQVRSIIVPSSDIALGKSIELESGFCFWLEIMDTGNDPHSVEKLVELLRQLAAQNLNEAGGYWILRMLFNHNYRRKCNPSIKFIFVENVLLWRVVPTYCLTWIIYFAELVIPLESSSSRLYNACCLSDTVHDIFHAQSIGATRVVGTRLF